MELAVAVDSEARVDGAGGRGESGVRCHVGYQ